MVFILKGSANSWFPRIAVLIAKIIIESAIDYIYYSDEEGANDEI